MSDEIVPMPTADISLSTMPMPITISASMDSIITISRTPNAIIRRNLAEADSFVFGLISIVHPGLYKGAAGI